MKSIAAHTPSSLEKRIKKLRKILSQSCLVLFSRQEMESSFSLPIPRQEGFFFYLTGFSENNCVFIVKGDQLEGVACHLFLEEKNEKTSLWNGHRLGVEKAHNLPTVNRAYPIQTLWNKLPKILEGCRKIYTNFPYDSLQLTIFFKTLLSITNTRRQPYFPAIHDAREVAGKLRAIKTKEEITCCRKSTEITSLAFSDIRPLIRSGVSEKDIAAKFTHAIIHHGGDGNAYPPIVAAGKNACILHYNNYQNTLKSGDLVLVDAGASYQYYAADVTRTFPVDGQFSPVQKNLYQLVLEAQNNACSFAKPDKTIDDIHHVAVTTLIKGLCEQKIFKESPDEVYEKKLYKKYYPHLTSHWIGIDVHDVDSYFDKEGKTKQLKPGMYLSIEPGLYFPPDDLSIPQSIRGIGIRIEDDILITESGHEILSGSIPKTLDEIENF